MVFNTYKGIGYNDHETNDQAAAQSERRKRECIIRDPGRRACLDKIISLFCPSQAVLQDGKGMPEESEKSLRTAVRMAAAFDSNPTFTLENVILLGNAEKQSVYNETRAPAIDCLNNTLKESGHLIPDTFREKAKRVIEAVGP